MGVCNLKVWHSFMGTGFGAFCGVNVAWVTLKLREYFWGVIVAWVTLKLQEYRINTKQCTVVLMSDVPLKWATVSLESYYGEGVL